MSHDVDYPRSQHENHTMLRPQSRVFTQALCIADRNEILRRAAAYALPRSLTVELDTKFVARELG